MLVVRTTSIRVTGARVQFQQGTFSHVEVQAREFQAPITNEMLWLSRCSPVAVPCLKLLLHGPHCQQRTACAGRRSRRARGRALLWRTTSSPSLAAGRPPARPRSAPLRKAWPRIPWSATCCRSRREPGGHDSSGSQGSSRPYPAVAAVSALRAQTAQSKVAAYVLWG